MTNGAVPDPLRLRRLHEGRRRGRRPHPEEELAGRLLALHPDRLVRVRPDAEGQHRRGGPRPREGDPPAPSASPVTWAAPARRVPRMSTSSHSRNAPGPRASPASASPRCPAPSPAAHAVTGTSAGDHPRRGLGAPGRRRRGAAGQQRPRPRQRPARDLPAGHRELPGAPGFDFFGNDWEIFAKPSAKPGTYAFTYYACDFSYLTPGTITVTVEPLPKISVTKVSSQPGQAAGDQPGRLQDQVHLRLVQGGRARRHLPWPRTPSVVIPVHRTRIDWIATNGKGDLFLGTGHVTGIKVAPGASQPGGRVTLSPRQAQLWRTA